MIETIKAGQYTTLIVTELSRLSRSIGELLFLLEKLEDKMGIEVIATKNSKNNNLPKEFKLMRRIFADYFAQQERNIISQRTKKVLQSKKDAGIKLGKLLGSIQKSIYDDKKEEIKLLLSKDIPLTNISKIIGLGKTKSLVVYLKRRNLKVI